MRPFPIDTLNGYNLALVLLVVVVLASLKKQSGEVHFLTLAVIVSRHSLFFAGINTVTHIKVMQLMSCLHCLVLL